MTQQLQRALIYARVSTKKQDPMAQLIRCQEYCQQKGYFIEQTFEDKFTGGGNFMQRPAMRELLAFAKANAHNQYIVVFDDLKRFARDTKFHIELRTTFKSNGLIPECLNYNFDDSPEGRFMEIMFAAQNELERHQNRRQVIQKQRARLIAGYNAFVAPIGYKKIKKDPVHGTIDVPDSKAKALQKALKGFAYGELPSRMAVARFLKQKGVLGEQNPEKYLETVKNVLSNVFYAGYIEYLPWDVTRRKGHHKALITLQEYEMIQKRLHKTDHYTPIRRDINPDFPLRGFVNCYYCKTKLTACKSRGRWGGLYYKYYCRNKDCYLRRKKGIKSVSCENLHREFKELLDGFRVSEKKRMLAEDAFYLILNSHLQQVEQEHRDQLQEKAKWEDEIDTLISLIADPNTTDVIRDRYTKKVEDLAQKIVQTEALFPSTAEIRGTCRTLIKKTFDALQDPYNIWSLSDIKAKQSIFNLFFEGNLEYKPEGGFRTPKMSLLIRLFQQISAYTSVDVNIVDKSSNLITTASIHQFVEYANKINALLKDQ